ncbi:MAG: hypothetical protein HQL91_05130 [Magnetococcales bacterium]|nr:hypothetical protein [Magnetococcales bacterium]
MSHAVTFDDVWKMFQETRLQFQEMVREDRERRAETDRRMQEMVREDRERRAETDRRMQEMDREDRERRAETDRRMQETDRQMRESRAETEHQMRESRAETERQMRESRAETDRQLQENARQMRETDLQIKAVGKQIGELGGRLGQFIEEMIKPSCLAMFQARGLQVDEVFGRAKKVVDGKRMEIDILLANTVDAVLIEVKSHLTAEDVQDHLDRLTAFKRFFPRFANCQVYGAVAGMVIASEADLFAMRKGLFVIAQTGDSVQLANAPDFVPRSW